MSTIYGRIHDARVAHVNAKLDWLECSAERVKRDDLSPQRWKEFMEELEAEKALMHPTNSTANAKE